MAFCRDAVAGVIESRATVPVRPEHALEPAARVGRVGTARIDVVAGSQNVPVGGTVL
jgi:hypothetical protein